MGTALVLLFIGVVAVLIASKLIQRGTSSDGARNLPHDTSGNAPHGPEAADDADSGSSGDGGGGDGGAD